LKRTPAPRGDVVRFNVRVRTPNGTWGMKGDYAVEGDNLADTLREIADQARDFARQTGADSQP
jgi:hypothetical protein